MQKIKIGILGYGNLGRGVELAVAQNEDMELVGVFSRRNPDSVKTALAGTRVYALYAMKTFVGKIDVMILCGGSATDLPEQTPACVADFNCVDSFDTHAKIPEHFAAVDAVAKKSGKVGLISIGWDPGMFSLNRLLGNALLPQGCDYTFWGKGVSQGHSDAIRRIEGVADAKQYTIPVTEALDAVRAGKNPTLSTRQKHTRECFVVAKPDADLARIENEIKTMPNYFADYDTTVHFISQEELNRDHAGIPHGGFVLRSGTTGVAGETQHVLEYAIKLGSNPEFTASVLVAYARAAVRLASHGGAGAFTIFDIPPAWLSPKSAEALRAELL